ncbi:SDR family oxidoreductase [Nocardia alni]|uniref:SDR family oxidoreductase n=1 Tax=Nocardia alni TaxID=2815723 RepID=UPI001C246294|nr:aldehyde reductase [Nocardia alni]
MTSEQVLVTGGSGFLGAHCVVRLLDDGYRVRTTVRSPERAPAVRAMLAASGSSRADSVSFTAADLTSDRGWDDAMTGCDRVLHVASPFPPTNPAREDDLIVPAREGTLRVLRAARDAGVRRVVVTSSFAAIGYGHAPTDIPYDESSWTELSNGVTTYAKSKTLAERAAWDFVANEGKDLELSVVNPTGIFGPALGPDYGTSIATIVQLLGGALPRLPKVSAGLVDVRDVADLHVRAMTDPAAVGERFLATAGQMTLREMALAIRASLGEAARRVPTGTLPDWVVRLAALFDASARQALPMLGRPHRATSDKARRVLGWQPRTAQEAVTASAESVLRLGLIEAATTSGARPARRS